MTTIKKRQVSWLIALAAARQPTQSAQALPGILGLSELTVGLELKIEEKDF